MIFLYRKTKNSYYNHLKSQKALTSQEKAMTHILPIRAFHSHVDTLRETKVGNLLGRGVTCVKDAGSALSSSPKFVIVKVLEILNAVKNDCNALATFFRGTGYALMGLKECGVTVLSKFGGRASDAVNLIDAVQVLGDIQYVVTGQWKDDSAPQLIGRVVLGVTDVIGLGMWAEELGFGLSRAVTAIGNVRCFGFVPLIPLGSIVTGFVGVGFFFLGVDAAWRLYKTKDVTEKQDPNVSVKRIKAIFDLTWCGLEVAGKVVVVAAAMSIIPVAAPGVVATLGVTAASFGLLSFAYGVYNKKRLDESALIANMQR